MPQHVENYHLAVQILGARSNNSLLQDVDHILASCLVKILFDLGSLLLAIGEVNPEKRGLYDLMQQLARLRLLL